MRCQLDRLSCRLSCQQNAESATLRGYDGTVTTPPNVETDLGWALGTVMRSYLRAAGEAVADLPGGPRGYQVLSVAACGEAQSQLKMAQHLGVDRTVMTYLLDDLENAGLIERKPDPSDRRARRIVLTEAGRTRMCELERQLREVEAALLQPLEPAEREVLRELLRRLAVSSGERLVNACTVAAHMQAEDAESTRRRRRR
jgi:DNA-binding MarR family transcriptional regulator